MMLVAPNLTLKKMNDPIYLGIFVFLGLIVFCLSVTLFCRRKLPATKKLIRYKFNYN